MAAHVGCSNFDNTLRMRGRSREALKWTWLDGLVEDLRCGEDAGALTVKVR